MKNKKQKSFFEQLNMKIINPHPDETYQVTSDDHCAVVSSGSEKDSPKVWLSKHMIKWLNDNSKKLTEGFFSRLSYLKNQIFGLRATIWGPNNKTVFPLIHFKKSLNLEDTKNLCDFLKSKNLKCELITGHNPNYGNHILYNIRQEDKLKEILINDLEMKYDLQERKDFNWDDNWDGYAEDDVEKYYFNDHDDKVNFLSIKKEQKEKWEDSFERTNDKEWNELDDSKENNYGFKFMSRMNDNPENRNGMEMLLNSGSADGKTFKNYKLPWKNLKNKLKEQKYKDNRNEKEELMISIYKESVDINKNEYSSFGGSYVKKWAISSWDPKIKNRQIIYPDGTTKNLNTINSEQRKIDPTTNEIYSVFTNKIYIFENLNDAKIFIKNHKKHPLFNIFSDIKI